MLLPAFCRLRFSSVAQSCLTLCDPMNCGMLGLPAHYQALEFTQTHVHWVGDAIQQSYPLSSPSLPTFNLSHHQDLFKRPLLHTFEETDSKNPCIKQHKGKFENLRKMVSYNSRSFQIKGIQFIYFFFLFLTSFLLYISMYNKYIQQVHSVMTFDGCTHSWWEVGGHLNHYFPVCNVLFPSGHFQYFLVIFVFQKFGLVWPNQSCLEFTELLEYVSLWFSPIFKMLSGMISTNVLFSAIFYLLFFWDSQPTTYSYRSLDILLQIPKALLLFSVMSFFFFSLLLHFFHLPFSSSASPPSSPLPHPLPLLFQTEWLLLIDLQIHWLFPHYFYYAVTDHQLCFKFQLFHFSVLKFPFRSFSTLSKSLFNSSIFHLWECVPLSHWEKL